MQYLEPMTADETHSECVYRVRQSNRYAAFKPEPLDHDFHITAWRLATWDRIEEIAWLRRQEKELQDGH